MTLLQPEPGGYRVVLADPPWRNRGNGRARKYYKFLGQAAIEALPVADLRAPNSVLLLWSTWTELEHAMAVVAAWGYEYMTGFPWIKTYSPPFTDITGSLEARVVYGTGYWLRGCSEPVLIGWHGDTKPGANQFMGLLSERLQHSRKPESIYHFAEGYPGPYLELFARRARPGWHAWGNEAPGCIDLPGFPSLAQEGA